jgi:hypothetical protein
VRGLPARCPSLVPNVREEAPTDAVLATDTASVDADYDHD